jgi:hypothetical protein
MFLDFVTVVDHVLTASISVALWQCLYDILPLVNARNYIFLVSFHVFVFSKYEACVYETSIYSTLQSLAINAHNSTYEYVHT